MNITKEFLEREYLVNKKSMKQIEREFGVKSVFYFLNKFGIKTRDISEIMKGVLPWNTGKRDPNKLHNFQKDIIKRDRECKICGLKDKLETHHIKDREKYPDFLTNPSYSITLCQACHKRVRLLMFPRKFIEKTFDIQINTNITSIGYDVATKTGICLINQKDDYVQFKLWTLEFVSGKELFDVINKIDDFLKIIIPQINFKNQKTVAIIEDSFLKLNPYVFKFLSRLSGVFFVKNTFCNSIKYIQAGSARKRINLKGNSKKEEVKEFLAQHLYTWIDDDNQADAIVLAINGLIEESTLV